MTTALAWFDYRIRLTKILCIYFGDISSRQGKERKNKPKGLQQIRKLLHNKSNHQQNEKGTH